MKSPSDSPVRWGTTRILDAAAVSNDAKGSDLDAIPLLIEFAPQTSLYRERDLVSQLPIVRNGPAGTFVIFPTGVKVSLPTDQIVVADDTAGFARVGFGGMSYVGIEDGHLIFVRVRDLQPEEQLSPSRSHRMRLEQHMVSSILVNGRPVWRADGPSPT
jgi:hypothetical protein